ncbi:uncharacterized protein LAESUDRAFT_733178 [Laetiporus sulphureus 93-53]|uniref:Uncharacterized protein n=1 Tax=Laetiporus sulphureus 93-53 TaxID=1314785 RepID=A0A165I2F7_9APHY|nr:uncharacterized protein LAESUDRAFT_733178 [Laetiporus sulphureus 93-53]KZT12502.1 hypothetical protein LAESUDRAFT_733178 [Laetiporus sulphureus 93-53]
MLSLRSARLAPISHVGRARKPLFRTRRTLVHSAVQELTNGFLDLAIALPIPPSLPPYSTTVILLTVASRLVITVPFSVWAKDRQWRAENIVVPQLKREMQEVHKQILQDMKVEGFQGDKDAALAEVKKRLDVASKSRKGELLKIHHCTPLPTMIIPPLTQLPMFVCFSMVLNNACQPPTVLDSESFFTLTSLAHPDPTAALPIMIGLITLANVETARWFVGAAALQRERQVARWVEQRRAKGEAVVEPRKVVQSVLRLASVFRILFATMLPGSVEIYWAASAAFGLVQSWVLEWWHARRTHVYQRSSAPLTWTHRGR